MDNITNCVSEPVCHPNKDTLWYTQTYNLVTWWIMNPRFIYYESFDLYFYYIENYIYFPVKNFTKIDVNNGYYSVYVNDEWFPNNYINKTWNFTLLIVGSGKNPAEEINDKLSKFPKINFNIIQNGTYGNENNTNYQNSSISQNENINTNNNIKIETWKIIVISICSILFVIISIILIRLVYIKKRIIKNNKEPNEICSIIKIDIKEKYQKPNSY